MINSVLPYWDQNIDLDVASWLPYGKDYSPVSVNGLYDQRLDSVAGLAFEMKSEFLYLRSFQSGNVGTMARQNMIDPMRNSKIELGFTMVFAYSEEIERSLLSIIPEFPGMLAGLTLCDIWDGAVLIDECKVIMLVNDDPFFNETEFMESLCGTLKRSAGIEKPNISFFAEKFGYRRFCISYETDDTTQMRITQMLFDMELDATKDILGPVPELKIPQLPSLG